MRRLKTLGRRSPSTTDTTRAPSLLEQFRALVAQRDLDRPRADGAPLRVGFASFGAGTPHLVVDCLLAHALELRGATCQLLVCDLPELPGCDERTLELEDNQRCAGCITPKLPFLEASGLDWVRLSACLPHAGDTLASATRAVAACPDDQLKQFELDGWDLGNWLGSSVASFLRSDSHGMHPEVVEARRRYLVSGIVALTASQNWITEFRPDIVVVISGRHIFWRAAREVARSQGIKVVCREMFNEDFDCHIYAVNSSCEDPALPRAWAEARRTLLTPTQEESADHYLAGLPAFARQVDEDPELESRASAIRERLGLGDSRPVVALFTNVTWDLFVAERDFAFDGQMEWISTTLDFVREHPELDLVVRAHPAEIVPRFRTRGRIIAQISQACSPVPPNVRLVGPESDISSDALRSIASLNLVYCSSVGMEAVIAGQPVLIAGDPYYARKGFTIDVDSREQYVELLREHAAGSPPVAPPESIDLARRFLHLYRFRWGMKMGLTTSDVGSTKLTITDFDQLMAGRSLALDTACEGILFEDEILLPS